MPCSSSAWSPSNRTPQALAFSLWEAIFSVVIVSALAPLTFFRSRCDWQGLRLRWLSHENYWVSIIHTQFIVSIRLVLMPLDLSTLTKFVRSAGVVIPFCYVVPWSLRRIPIVA